MKPNQLIILGGGRSILQGIPLGLWDKLQGKFTCSLNFSSQEFLTTYLCFVDVVSFYDKHKLKLIR